MRQEILLSSHYFDYWKLYIYISKIIFCYIIKEKCGWVVVCFRVGEDIVGGLKWITSQTSKSSWLLRDFGTWGKMVGGSIKKKKKSYKYLYKIIFTILLFAISIRLFICFIFLFSVFGILLINLFYQNIFFANILTDYFILLWKSIIIIDGYYLLNRWY